MRSILYTYLIVSSIWKMYCFYVHILLLYFVSNHFYSNSRTREIVKRQFNNTDPCGDDKRYLLKFFAWEPLTTTFNKMAPLPGIGVDINYIAIVSLFLSFVDIVHIVYFHLFILILEYDTIFVNCTCFAYLCIMYTCLYRYMFVVVNPHLLCCVS